ncbi:SGNH/GDSL hydrolase family protein [Sphingobacteriales bacterium CHB3]|nr:SGNH/GDSL hydrolase family protein [Sphingobacteriales bacterium CHB3]
MRIIASVGILSTLISPSFSQNDNDRNSVNQQSRTFLALGDSYTIGEAVAETERWPMQLASILRKRTISIDDPVIIARTGWTTDELNAAIDASNIRGPFDLVTLLIGVNNQYRGRSADEYRVEFKQLLQRAIHFAGGAASHVIVVSIPDWGVMPFAEGRDRKKIAKEIDMFNAVNWEESVRARTQYVDITPISREVERYPELIASDGLHPSGVQYKYWGELIEPKACTALGIETEKEKK